MLHWLRSGGLPIKRWLFVARGDRYTSTRFDGPVKN
ncbi:MAG: hypothetical protein JWQ07_324 [Ramlibacter sp.]|nr:hypothetical protein [Ramlibacter sp.]